jgi:5-methylcytosine-specific restriction endonuclease McrA
VIQRLAKPRPSRLDARTAARKKAENWREASVLVKARDKGKCRLCGKSGTDCHHIEFRSRGGKDVPENLILVCRTCHSDIHGHVVKLAGTATALRVGRWDDDADDHQWSAA